MTDDGLDALESGDPYEGVPPVPSLKERNASALSGIDDALRGVLEELKATNRHLGGIERQLSSLRSRESQREGMDHDLTRGPG